MLFRSVPLRLFCHPPNLGQHGEVARVIFGSVNQVTEEEQADSCAPKQLSQANQEVVTCMYVSNRNKVAALESIVRE